MLLKDFPKNPWATGHPVWRFLYGGQQRLLCWQIVWWLNVYEEHWPLIQSSEPFEYINNDTYLSFVLKIALELPHSLCWLACEGFESGKVWKLNWLIALTLQRRMTSTLPAGCVLIVDSGINAEFVILYYQSLSFALAALLSTGTLPLDLVWKMALIPCLSEKSSLQYHLLLQQWL